MLDSIEIKNFKRIGEDGLKLDKLAQVNYLVGENGSGKSSVLEAIKIAFCNPTELLDKVIFKSKAVDSLEKHPKREDIHRQEYNKGTVSIDVKHEIKISVDEKNNNSVIKLPDASKLNLMKMISLEIVESETSSNNVSIFSGNKGRFREKAKQAINNFLKNTNESLPDYSLEKNSRSDFRFVDISESLKPNLFMKGLQPINGTEEYKSVLHEWEDNSKLLFNWSGIFNGNPVVHYGQFDSDGEFKLQLLIDYIAYLICCNKYVNQGETILVLEEPENNLHPKWQKLLPVFFSLDGVKKILKEKQIKFLISTHSPFIINSALELDSKFIDSNKEERYSQKVYHLKDGTCLDSYGLDKQKLQDFGKIAPLYNIYGNLGMSPSDLLFSKSMVWVEGPTDAIYIEFWLKKYAEQYSKPVLKKGLDYDFSTFGGAVAENFYLLEGNEEFDFTSDSDSKIFDLLKVHPKSFIVVDNDGGELLSDAKKHGDSKFEEFKKRVIVLKFDYWYDKNPNNFTIESYRKDFKACVKENGKKSFIYLGTKKQYALKYCKANSEKSFTEIVNLEGCEEFISKVYNFISASNK